MRFANPDPAVRSGFESRINFRHSFIEPHGPEQRIMAQEQMCEFVKYRIERIGALTGQIERDKILITAAQEERCLIGRFALVQAQKRLHRFVIRKGNHDNRWRCHCLCAGERRIRFPKLFQTRPDPGYLLIGAAAINVAMSRPGLEPVALEQRTQFGLRPDVAGQKQNAEPKRISHAANVRSEKREIKGFHAGDAKPRSVNL